MKTKFRYIAFIAILGLSGLISAMAEELSTWPIDIQAQENNVDVFDLRHDELIGLLNWAAYLSGYEINDVKPQLYFKPHQFFVDHACSGNQRCKVVGWYNDKGIVYIDQQLNSLESRFARSLVVHEFVHYLQHISGKFKSGTCQDFVEREREAYAVQREFIMAYGSMPSMSFNQHSCVLDSAKVGNLVSTKSLH